MNKKKLLVSFSGGETSAFMAQWLLKHKSDEYEMIFVFANTGQENEETLEFVDKCDKEFGLGVVWVEAVVHHGKRKGTTHKVVNFETADRDGVVFEEVIKKYMIPNIQNMICSRELKERPITSYARSIGWKRSDYETAIGIRTDEFDRMSERRKENRIIYPLISMQPMTKPMISFFWKNMPFRLNLKGYEGNCKTCWKKSFRKLGTIAQETPEKFGFFKRMEEKYGNFISDGRKHNDKIQLPIRFFRTNKDVAYIFNEVVNDPKFKRADDDSINYETDNTLTDGIELDMSNGCIESCEVFT